MKGSEIFIRKAYSVKITDLAKSIAPGVKMREIGMRPGEKITNNLLAQMKLTLPMIMKSSIKYYHL